MKKIFLSIVIVLIGLCSYAQTTVRANDIIADNGLFPPVRDTLVNPRRVGELRHRPQDTTIYYAISMLAPHKWLALGKGSGGGGGVSADSLLNKVNVNASNLYGNVITNTHLRQSAAYSVIGRSANSTGNVADISAASNEDVLFRNGDVLSFGKPNVMTRQGNVIGDLLVKTSLADTVGLTGVGNGGGIYTISGSKLIVTSSASTSIRSDSLTSLDVIEIDNIISFNSFGVTQYGFTTGITGQTTDGNGRYGIYGWLFAGTGSSQFGRMFIESYDQFGNVTRLATSLTDLSMDATDSIDVRLEKFENTIRFSARNLTDNTSWINVYYTLTGTQTSYSVGYAGVGGAGISDFNIHQYKITSKQVHTPDVYLFGDSKFTKSTYQNESLVALLKNNYVQVYANCAVGSTSADLVANRWEVINIIQPKKVLIAVSNDIRFGISTGTWQANLTLLYDDFTAAGIDVYFISFYETGASQSAMDTWLAANYPTKYIRRVYTDLSKNTGVLLGDNIHLSAFGNKVAYDAIVLDGKLETVATLPTVTETSTTTFTNKRWTARVGSTTSSGTPTINTDNYDVYKLTAQAADITSMTSNLSGTPVDGDILEIQITGTGSHSLTWGASFVSSTVTLPTTFNTNTLTIILQYYSTSSYGNTKWVCVNFY